MGSRRYILRKVAGALLTLFFVLVFNFFLFRILPSDPVKFLTRGAGLEIDPQEQQELLREFGLDKPVFPGQFLDYIGDTLRLDFGTSLTVQSGRSVLEIFFAFMWPTLLLVGVSTFFSVLIGVWMGIRAGWRRGGAFDREFDGGVARLLLDAGVLAGHAVDHAVLGRARMVPERRPGDLGADYTGFAAVADVLNHLFLPALTLTLALPG